MSARRTTRPMPRCSSRLFKQWGWDAHIEQFDVLYPTPISTTLELIAPEHVMLGGQEPPVAEDPTSSSTAEALPPYVAYQGDGDVTAPVVYVNYGMPDDYDALEQRGISVKGKIVLARYGGGWRGLKPKLAQEHGAVGCLIYSDPADDGYAEGDVYPQGGGRPAGGVQRGSVADMTDLSGRSADAGRRRDPDAKRLTRAEAPTILKIPALPISYARRDRRSWPRCRARSSPAARAAGLPLAYHWGGTDAVQVHLAVKSDWSLKPIYDVIAMLHGVGLSRPMDRPRQPPRRLGIRRRGSADRPGRADERGQGAGRALPPGLAAGADHRLRKLGRRGAGPAGIDRMGRNPRRRAEAQGAPLHQHGQQRPRLPLRRGQSRPPAFRRCGRERRARPADRSVRSRASRARILADSYSGPDSEPSGRRRRGEVGRRPAARARWLGLGLFAVRAASRHPVDRTSVSAARTRPDGSYHSAYDTFIT